jgi:hypothetical protein
MFHKGQWFLVEKAKSNTTSEKEPNQLFGPNARKRFNGMEQVLGKEVAGNSIKKSKDGGNIHCESHDSHMIM